MKPSLTLSRARHVNGLDSSCRTRSAEASAGLCQNGQTPAFCCCYALDRNNCIQGDSRMNINTLLLIILVVILLGGGGFYFGR